MLKYGTMSSIQLAYMWLAIDNGQSVLISGGTATGKTSMLNALSLFIRPNLKIVSIEDTAELRIPHPHWIPEVARTPIALKGTIGEVSLFDLLKSSLRQRPDYIVMGEVRGKEAFVLFQQMATGHPSLATIHAASINQLVDRLTTPPISLPPSLIENINVIVFLTLSRMGGKYVRRTNKILEVIGIKGDKPFTSDIFRWEPSSDSYKTVENSTVLRNISERMSFTEDELKGELVRRKAVLEWMFDQKIYDYREVAKIISAYYNNPQRVMSAIGGGL
jgi:flagellar protein FlaI